MGKICSEFILGLSQWQEELILTQAKTDLLSEIVERYWTQIRFEKDEFPIKRDINWIGPGNILFINEYNSELGWKRSGLKIQVGLEKCQLVSYFCLF